jgi:aminocarboxymuconate-semialdehyde decarboxylase
MVEAVGIGRQTQWQPRRPLTRRPGQCIDTDIVYQTSSESRPRVDFHAHLAPALPDDALRETGVTRNEQGRLAVDGHPVGPPGLYDRDKLCAFLDERGLDEAVVSPPPPFFRQGLDAEARGRWVEAVNAGTLAAVAGESRLLPLAYLPFEDPAAALRAYEPIRSDGRWAGVCGSAGGSSASLADDAFAPLWLALDDDAALVFLHPGMSPDPRLGEFYLHNLLGNPVETAVAAAQLVFGDVLAAHPRMRVMLVHCGGCVPDLVPRWDRGVETSRPGVAPLREPPSLAVRRLFVDCLVHDPGAVNRAVAVFGEDRIVLGSDWPFPMGTEDPISLIAHRGAEFVRRVACDNAATALGRGPGEVNGAGTPRRA